MFFDDFKDSQNVSYTLLKNSIVRDRISHAYLFDTNNNDNAYEFVLSFIKMIICPNHYSNDSFGGCNNCSICHRIDGGNYPEIKVIESDSSVIKKEQLLELQSDFSTASIEGNYRIYIIKDCDKMNKHASNSLLKFLEEPTPGIIAILMTNHINKLLSTIISRCQLVHLEHVLKLSNDSSFSNLAYVCCDSYDDIKAFIDDDAKKDIMDSVIEFVTYFEDNGLDILLFMKKMWYNRVQTRDDNIIAFKILVYFYYDVLKCKMEYKDFIFCNHSDVIMSISSKNTIDMLVKKIDVLQYGYDMVLSNLNINLLLDDIVIRLGDVS